MRYNIITFVWDQFVFMLYLFYPTDLGEIIIAIITAIIYKCGGLASRPHFGKIYTAANRHDTTGILHPGTV